MTGAPAGERTRGDRAYAQLLERALLPAGDLVLRTEFVRELRRWRRIQHLSGPAIAQLQRSALQDVLRHASTAVPHYRDLRIEPHDDPYEWLRRFPLLTKADLRSSVDRLRTPGA